jgi:phosphatidylglycerol:prolipoprotein diacylglycerol transferase
MHPHLLDSLSTYAVFHGLALFVAGGVLVFAAVRAGLADRPRLRLQVTCLLLSGIAAAKLFSLFERGAFVSARWELFYGYAYAGGITALVLALPVVVRLLPNGLSALALGDLLAPAVGAAVVVMRLGCFLGGCCFGTVSDLPWTVRFPELSPAWASHLNHGRIAGTATESLPVHPLQLYFALAALAVTVILLGWQRRKTYDGQLLLLYLALHEPAKAALEGFRAEASLGPPLLSLALGLCAAGVLFARAAQARSNLGARVGVEAPRAAQGAR